MPWEWVEPTCYHVTKETRDSVGGGTYVVCTTCAQTLEASPGSFQLSEEERKQIIAKYTEKSRD